MLTRYPSEVEDSQLKFAEALPSGCPPTSAVDNGLNEVWRLVESANPTDEDFKSHAARGIPMPPQKDACLWSACSLWSCNHAARNVAKKFPKLRDNKKFMAKLNIQAGCGYSIEENKHVSFWRFDGISLASAVSEVEPL